jgi:hypothetical protein
VEVSQFEWQDSAESGAGMADIHAWFGSERNRIRFRGEGSRYLGDGGAMGDDLRPQFGNR